MANLKATIVVHANVDGKRRWIKANGKTDPTGTYYLRSCKGSIPHYTRAGETYADAELAQFQLERKLKAASQGFTVPDQPSAMPSHRCTDVLKSYLAHIRQKTKPNGRRYNEQSIRDREANIQEFLTLAGHANVEQIDHTDLSRYKEFLEGRKRKNDTVYNKLACITPWLRHNQLVKIKLPLFKDWPVVANTKSHPFSEAEIEAMLAVAGEHSLLIRVAHATGMRKGELMHAMRSDVSPTVPYIEVMDKPFYGWETKTVDGNRNIPLAPDLWEDLLAMPAGLLFPNKHGHPDVRIDRRFQEVGARAKVAPPTNDRACWVHRWRDTMATMLIRSNVMSLLHIAYILGHKNTDMLSVYVQTPLMDSPEAKAAAEYVAKYGGGKAGPVLVRAAGK